MGAYNGFTIHVLAAVDGVYIEPSVLEFSSASAGALRTFSVHHVSLDADVVQYRLQYLLKFAGNTAKQAIDISDYMPMHARNVLVKRYSVIPEFPKVLSYGWQQASFNLTRGNAAHLSLIPHMPRLDGQQAASYGGHAVAGGRIQFDPPVIVFAPGQMVQQFLVKAMPGVQGGAEAVYYRVDWQMVGHEADLSCYDEAVNARASAGSGTAFATWHVASASVARVAMALMAVAALIVAAL